MLTISRLAAYAGVTVRAVRHYHQIGLLPEPERDHSGYRTYDVAAVVRLIRIRTLADAGVPLARVQELLDASQEEFAHGVQEIDERAARRDPAPAGQPQADRPARRRRTPGPPAERRGYLDRLRGLGVDERYIELERDGWIMVAAQVPELIDAIIACKHEELDDPDMVGSTGCSASARLAGRRPRIVEIADILERLMFGPSRRARWASDASTTRSSTCWTRRRSSPHRSPTIVAILEERGWKGWTRIERVPDGVASRMPR